jgi:serine/threonine protein kinase
MVMELLEGKDLGQELTDQGPLPIALAADYLLQAIDAIAEAHAAGIVHRDLKPTNLFLAQGADGTRKIKVLDFGISKSIGPHGLNDIALTKTALMIGSPLYMSPEQMRSAKDVDGRTDIWSLGAILYEMVSGQVPFFSNSVLELCASVLNDPPRPIRTFLASAPTALEVILEKCLAKDLSQRFASVADLADALVELVPEARNYAERARRLLVAPAMRANLTPSQPPLANPMDPTPREAPTPATQPYLFASPTPKASAALPGKTSHATNHMRKAIIILGGILVLVSGAFLVWHQWGLDAEAKSPLEKIASPALVAPRTVAPRDPPVVPQPTAAAPQTAITPSPEPVVLTPPKPLQATHALPRSAGDKGDMRKNKEKAKSRSVDTQPSVTDFGDRYY